MRLLFYSIHCHLDPSSGAALCTRELLELLAGRGMDCRVLTTGILDPEGESSLDELLATLELPAGRFQAQLGPGRAAQVVVDLDVNGVRVTVMPVASSRAERSPDRGDKEQFPFMVDVWRVLGSQRPGPWPIHVGHPPCLNLPERRPESSAIT